MEVDNIVINLLESIDWDEAVENSYKNFHVRGLHYINLFRSERFTAKLYVFVDACHNPNGYLVHPHNHGYSFVHRTLVGEITNHIFEVSGGEDWTAYSFDTPLNGGKGLSSLFNCGLTHAYERSYFSGDSYSLSPAQIHTISVQSGFAAACLLQFHDVAPGKPTVMFAPKNESPDCESGLYEKMSVWQAKGLVSSFRNAWSEV